VTYFFIDCPPPSGTKSKGTILLIHGYPETSYQWRHVITPLSDAGYRVIAPDCRGAGYSSKTRGMEGYSKKSIAADLAKLLEILEIKEKIHVVGHDIGGMTAHSFASQYPDKTASVMWGECPQPGTKKYGESPGTIETKTYTDSSVSEETKNTEAVWHFTFQQQSDLPEALVQGRERM
jgi:pimeloyl-ACP methyl ester carboxylesterase